MFLHPQMAGNFQGSNYLSLQKTLNVVVGNLNTSGRIYHCYFVVVVGAIIGHFLGSDVIIGYFQCSDVIIGEFQSSDVIIGHLQGSQVIIGNFRC